MRALSAFLSAILLVVLQLGAAPTAQAAERPVITAIGGVVGPPSVLVDTECDQSRIDCGDISLDVTFGRVGALPVGEFSAYLVGKAHVVRTFGCADGSGTRLHRYDAKDVGEHQLFTRRDFPLSKAPGDTTVRGTIWDFLGNARPAQCPSGTRETLYGIAISAISLELSSLGDTPTTYTYDLSDGWSWAGAVTAAAPTNVANSAVSLESSLLTVQQPAAPGTAAQCPSVNGCGQVGVQARISRVLPGSEVLRGALKVSGRLVRSYGCVNASGKLLHRYDKSVVERAAFNGGSGVVFTFWNGAPGVFVSVVAELEDGQPGKCPSGTRATLRKIKISKLTVVLVGFTKPEQRTTAALPGRATWSGNIVAS
jgi:hypothetical protein